MEQPELLWSVYRKRQSSLLLVKQTTATLTNDIESGALPCMRTISLIYSVNVAVAIFTLLKHRGVFLQLDWQRYWCD